MSTSLSSLVYYIFYIFYLRTNLKVPNGPQPNRIKSVRLGEPKFRIEKSFLFEITSWLVDPEWRLACEISVDYRTISSPIRGILSTGPNGAES